MDSLYVIIPAYNEGENIENCVNDWYPVVERYNNAGESRLVIINDGSLDNTYEILTKLKEDRPLLIPLTKENGGHGATVIFGYNYAIEHGADYVFQTDSDGQTNPDEFDEFWNGRREYDVLIGERHRREDGRDRKFVEDVVCILLRLFFGVKTNDANAPFRLMKADVLKKYISKLPKDYNIPNIMLTVFFLHYKENVRFIPISFGARKGGKNSINIRKIVKIGLKALTDFVAFRKSMKNT